MPNALGSLENALREATGKVVCVANTVDGICMFHLEKVMDLD